MRGFSVILLFLLEFTFAKVRYFAICTKQKRGKKCVFFLKRKNEPVKSDLFLEKAYEIYKQRARRLM